MMSMFVQIWFFFASCPCGPLATCPTGRPLEFAVKEFRASLTGY